jgi:thioredoxin 1
MTKNITIVSDDNFQSEVLDSELPVLLDFGAEWCPPCKKQLPILEKFAEANVGMVKVCKLDVDDAPKTATQFKVRNIPFLAVFKGGEMVFGKAGMANLADLSKYVAGEAK